MTQLRDVTNPRRAMSRTRERDTPDTAVAKCEPPAQALQRAGRVADHVQQGLGSRPGGFMQELGRKADTVRSSHPAKPASPGLPTVCAPWLRPDISAVGAIDSTGSKLRDLQGLGSVIELLPNANTGDSARPVGSLPSSDRLAVSPARLRASHIIA